MRQELKKIGFKRVGIFVMIVLAAIIFLMICGSANAYDAQKTIERDGNSFDESDGDVTTSGSSYPNGVVLSSGELPGGVTYCGYISPIEAKHLYIYIDYIDNGLVSNGPKVAILKKGTNEFLLSGDLGKKSSKGYVLALDISDPGSYLDDGFYYIQVGADGWDATDVGSIKIVWDYNYPNIIVDDIWWEDIYGNTDGEITAGQPIKIYYKLKNTGESTVVDTFYCRFYIDGQQVGNPITCYDKIKPGDTKNYNTLFNGQPNKWLSTGTHVISVEADINNDVIESNEHDNARNEFLHVIKAKWTFMVYMNGDNNLEKYAIVDFLELSSVGSSPDISVVVQLDRIDDNTLYNHYINMHEEADEKEAKDYVDRYSYKLYDDWTDCKRFFITKGMTPTEKNAIADLSEIAMDDGSELENFIEWSMDRFEADNTILAIWDHGGAWYGVSWDYTTGINERITMKELHETLSQSLDNKKLSILGFMDCLMANFEVCQAIKEFCNYEIGSEKVGWAYPDEGEIWNLDHILNYMENSIYPEQVAKFIIDNSFDNLQEYMKYESHTWSVMKLDKINNLNKNITTFAQKLKSYLADYRLEIANARENAQELNYFTYKYSVDDKLYERYGLVDLWHFAHLINQDINLPNDLRIAADNVKTSVRYVVKDIHHRHHTSIDGSDINVDDEEGLSIYFPYHKHVYENYAATYHALPYKNDEWSKFLDCYFDDNLPTNPSRFSSSHSISDWSNDPTIEVFWYGSSDDTNIKGYYYKWTIEDPDYIPNKNDDFVETNQITSPSLSTGNWYLHVRAMDYAGNLGDASTVLHIGPFWIDTSSPDTPSVTSSHTEGSWSTDNDISFYWTKVYDYGSGLSGYGYEWDHNSETLPAGKNLGYEETSKNFYGVSDGIWYFHLRALDYAGNWGGTDHYGPIKIDTHAPENWNGFMPSDYVKTQEPICSIKVTDFTSGLDISTAYYRYSTDNGDSWSEWIAADCTGYDGTTSEQTVTAYYVPFNQDSDYYNKIQFKIEDIAGNEGISPVYTVKIDTIPPGSASNLYSPSHETEEWSNDNIIYVAWTPAEDHPSSGLAGYSIEWNHISDYLPDEAMDIGPVASIISPPLDEGNDWYFHIRSVDNAGNWDDEAVHLGPFWVDATPPIQ